MLQKIKDKIFPFLIALTALSISASAALFSIIGLSQLFAGIGIAVVIMASSLEVAKLIIASILYQYRKTLGKLLKIYLGTALIVLMIITSAGIYGYLSQGYSTTANKIELVEQQITSLETKKRLFEENKSFLVTEKTQISKNISELRTGLSSNIILQSRDKNGNLITRESKNNRKIFESQLEVSIKEDEIITQKLSVLNDSIFQINNQISEVKSQLTKTSELGPLKYISKLTGKSMDKVINWFILIIIFVFDPLAVSLIVASNFAFERIKKNEKVNYSGPYPNNNFFDIGNEVIYENKNPEELKIHQRINELNNLLQQPSLSTRKRFNMEQEIKELNKQLIDPLYVPSNNYTKEY